MLVQKQQVLHDAPGALNHPQQPWQVTVEGDTIVASWKWMDATFFAPQEINDQTRNYTFKARLDDKGKWHEQDTLEKKSSNVGMSGGKIGLGMSSSTFKGKASQKSFSFGAGQDKQTGEVGFIGFKFDTEVVKKAVRDYLTYCGWKKAGMFG